MNNNSTEPNIFHFATKELSQDAFLCWLLSWAKNDYNKTETKDFIVLLKFLFKRQQEETI